MGCDLSRHISRRFDTKGRTTDSDFVIFWHVCLEMLIDYVILMVIKVDVDVPVRRLAGRGMPEVR